MTLIASLSVSLDGFYTGPDPSEEHMLGRGGEALHHWFEHDVADRAQLTASDVLRENFARTGALIMGRDSFDHAEQAWGAHPPFEMPIFVLTHRPREEDIRDGTTFHFVTDGFISAVEQATRAAAGAAVGLHGGGAIQQGIRAGLLEELQLHHVPVLLGSGRRLFEQVVPSTFNLTRVVESPGVTHITYALPKAPPSGE